MSDTHFIYLISFYIENTSARSPSDYCNDIESPPEKIIITNENGQLEETENPNFNKPSHSTHKETHFPVDLNYPLASSSGTVGSVWNIDLNQTPADEDK